MRYASVVLFATLMAVVLTTIVHAQPQLPEFDNNRDRSAFLLGLAERIAPTTGDEKYPRAMSAIAQAYGQIGEAEAAQEALMRVTPKDRSFAKAKVAMYLAQAGETDAATELLEEIGDEDLSVDAGFIKIDPKQDAAMALAKATVDDLTDEQLMDAFGKAKDPKVKQFYRDWFNAQNVAEGRKRMVATSISQYPDAKQRDASWVFIAEQLADRGQFDLAYDALSEVENDREYYDPFRRIMEKHVASGDLEGARKVADAHRQTMPGMQTFSYRKIAKAMAKQGRADEAIEMIQKQVEKADSQPACIANVVYGLCETGNPGKAWQVYQDHLKDIAYYRQRTPGLIGVSFVEAEDYDRGMEILGTLEGYNNQENNRVLKLVEAVAACMDNGNEQQAKRFLDRAVQEASAFGETKQQRSNAWHLAEGYIHIGDDDKALESLAQMPPSDPGKTLTLTANYIGSYASGVVWVDKGRLMPVILMLKQWDDPMTQVRLITDITERVKWREDRQADDG